MTHPNPQPRLLWKNSPVKLQLEDVSRSSCRLVISIAQFAININSNNVYPHIRVPNTLMRESYTWRHRNI